MYLIEVSIVNGFTTTTTRKGATSIAHVLVIFLLSPALHRYRNLPLTENLALSGPVMKQRFSVNHLCAMVVATKQGTLRWNNGRCDKTMDVAMKQWTLQWNNGRCNETMNVTMKRWTLQWNNGRCDKTMNVTMKQWTLRWNNRRCDKTMNVAMKQ